MQHKNLIKNTDKLEDGSHIKVSPTAYGVAFRRTLAEIEYAKVIYEELEKIKVDQSAEDVDLLEKMKAPELTPFFEARYKLVNKLLKEQEVNQVLEIAAGLSPRGILLATENPDLKYAELDLEAMVVEKEQIHASLKTQGKIVERPNHYLEKGDALNMDSLWQAVRHFEHQPLAVVNEGLMRYLTFEQKAHYAKNVATLLKQFGGVWITPDITLKGMMEGAKHRTSQMSKDLGINIEANLFENEAQARKFFEDLGFHIEVHPFREIEGELVSPGKLGTTLEQMADMLNKPVVYVMRLK